MLKNIFPVEDLRGLARKNKLPYITRTVLNPKVEEALSEDWAIEKKSKKSTRLKKDKSHNTLLEDRVWTLFYRMGFTHLSGKGGAFLVINPDDPKSPQSQVDVAGLDSEISIAVSCKSSKEFSKRNKFPEELADHAAIREKISRYINHQFKQEHKRHTVLAMFTNNANLTENDKKRAEDLNIVLFNEKDLEYYEQLTNHLGSAARYQFFSDALPGKSIEGLSIRIPALKTKMRGYNCYTFSISPDYLLKIAYISHRLKGGKASDITTYQRMVSKSRLNKIKEYISNQGTFPTNIVINLEKNRHLRFEKAKQEGDRDEGVLGWLNISPSYKSAWIIDGQHRLFAYSGHEFSKKGVLSVLAFEGIPSSLQAQLFVDINAKQKSVKQTLLRELYADLRWYADDDEERVSAVISKAIQTLDSNPTSPFYNRILLSDDKKTAIQCITLDSMSKALEKPGFYLTKIKKDIPEYGTLWTGENMETLQRTTFIINGWFTLIRDRASAWWDLGADEGGGLAMNDGITICINVLRSVFQHLESKGVKLIKLDNEELLKIIFPYGEVLGGFLGGLSEPDRKSFRSLRGGQGQSNGTRRCQQAIHEKLPEFDPPGLKDWVEEEKSGYNKKAREIVDRIEVLLQKTIIEELKDNFGEDSQQWWFNGVPLSTRKKVRERYEDDGGKRGTEECYFDLIDYRPTIMENWDIFGKIFASNESVSKEKRTKWLVEINDLRRIVSHASSGVHITSEQLSKLEEYENWLTRKISGDET